MHRFFQRMLAVPALAILILLSAANLSLAAQGGFNDPAAGAAMHGGGYSGPGPAIMTIEQAKSMRDDSLVTLRGNIVQHLGKDKYLFRDATGTIVVEIDHDEWGGQNVGPNDTVELYGEVDKEWMSVEIDVDRVVKK